jgi:hypothetical protein
MTVSPFHHGERLGWQIKFNGSMVQKFNRLALARNTRFDVEPPYQAGGML